MLARYCQRLASGSAASYYSAPTSAKDLQRLLKDTPTKPTSSFAAPDSSKSFRRPPQPTWKSFNANGVIRPHDLSYNSRRAAPPPPRKRPEVGPPPTHARYNDVFHQFSLDPLSQALNPAILSEFVSDMGKIYSRPITGMTVKSQRRLGKAIRRAKMMGVIPILSAPRAIPGTSKHRR
ncbi:hypothetical protein AX17_001312 [Amanita inopinata Kibby_2008]|nr:hypothetical protein AX17_001312 [Amanita inopinata Kibby_2008]